MSTAIPDAGTLVGFECNDRRVVAIVARALEHRETLVVPAGVVAQVWRDGVRQTRLARLLGSSVCAVLVLDDRQARAAGQICGVAGTTDIVDASVVVAATGHGPRVVTSDPGDIGRLDPHVEVVAI